MRKVYYVKYISYPDLKSVLHFASEGVISL
jgi:hypothetical protein